MKILDWIIKKIDFTNNENSIYTFIEQMNANVKINIKKKKLLFK